MKMILLSSCIYEFYWFICLRKIVIIFSYQLFCECSRKGDLSFTLRGFLQRENMVLFLYFNFFLLKCYLIIVMYSNKTLLKVFFPISQMYEKIKINVKSMHSWTAAESTLEDS